MTNDSQEFNLDEVQIARVLHFVMNPDGYREICRPALVVNDWPGSGRTGYVNLVVFPDGSNDGISDKHHHDVEGGLRTTEIGGFVYTPLWETSVLPNHAVKANRTWHWPRECSKLVLAAKAWIHPESKRVLHHNHSPGVIDTHNCYTCAEQIFYEAK